MSDLPRSQVCGVGAGVASGGWPREIGWGSNLVATFGDRLDDVRAAVVAGANAVAASLSGLPSADGWKVREVSGSFGVSSRRRGWGDLDEGNGGDDLRGAGNLRADVMDVSSIRPAPRPVGRILINGHDAGSAFTVAPRVALTAGHVVRAVAGQSNGMDSVVYVPEGGSPIAISEIQVDRVLDVALVHLDDAVKETLATAEAVDDIELASAESSTAQRPDTNGDGR